MARRSKGKKLLKIIKTIFYIFIGLFFILIILDSGLKALKLIFIIILLEIINFILVINIHEFGHFVFGMMYGYELLSYRIGFFSWNKENGKIKFRIIKNKGYSGLCMMIPKEETSVFKEVLFYASGILFNLLTGIITIVLSLLYINNQYLNIFLNLFGVISIFIGLLNLLPIMSSNNPSDGKIIWSLILKKPFAKELVIKKKILLELTSGIRPSQIDIPSINYNEISGITLQNIFIAYLKALDSNNLAEMIEYAKILEDNIDLYPTIALPGLLYELCYLGCITNDLNKAKTYYNRARNTLLKDKDVNGCRVKAYYEYYVNNDLNKALELCNDGLEVADKFPIKGQALVEQDLIKSLIDLINDSVQD